MSAGRRGNVVALLIAVCGVGAAQPREAGIFQDCDACPAMQVIPAGRFLMGEPPGAGEERKGWGGPEVAVDIRESFALSRTEITRAQFKAFLDSSGYRPDGACRAMWPGTDDAATPQVWLEASWPTGRRQSDDHPMICINYHDARAYVDWLNEQSHGRFQGRRIYALPSEAQFEYAARANTRGPWPWPGGSVDAACLHANVADAAYLQVNPSSPAFECNDGHAFTAPVGTYTANAFGVHDLIGNVWEWIQDCAADAHDLTSNPRDGSPLAAPPADCSRRVTRGGGFVSPPWWSRVTARGGGHDPAIRLSAMGFRVAASIDEHGQPPRAGSDPL